MTREEAIEIIKAVFETWEWEFGAGVDCGKEHKARDIAIKALKQEPKTDTWSIRNVADTLAKHRLIVEQEPCEDAISRQAVLDLIADYDLSMGQVVKGIHALPPVTSQPKTGHWEWVQYDYDPKLGNWYCSECRSVVIECVDKNDKGGIPLYKYCPQCGAKIQEVEN